MLDQYCVGCHNQKLKTAGLMLDKMDVTRVGENAEIWEKVVRKVRAGMMPPAGMPRPERKLRDEFAAALEDRLDRYAAANPEPGSVGLHRMNRAEYANAIRDLLALEIDVTSLLPADDASFGFDNMANSLGVSSALLNGYLSAASKISRLAIGDANVTPVLETFTVPADLSQDEHIEGLPLGTRGGLLTRYNFPADGEYRFQIALLRDPGNGEDLFGRMSRGEKLELSIDGQPKRVFDIDEEDSHRTFVDNVTQPLEARLPVTAGLHEVGVAFTKQKFALVEDVFSSSYLRSSITVLDVSRTALPHVTSVAIGGPFHVTGVSETPSRRRIFVCHPTKESEEVPCAQQIISALARRAYRRPVNNSDLEVLMAFYRKGSADGFEQGIEMALRRILASPDFTFRFEKRPANVKPGAAYRITDLELASRLSFFLWSSLPDDELLQLAAQEKLKDPVVLESQVRRMIEDPRSSELVRNFTGQWLQLRNLASVTPSPDDFPGFDDNLRNAFRRETEMFFGSIVHEDRSVLDLLAADYTFADERLARHYGIPNVYGSQFRRISLADTPRRGLLGQGSILTVTSLPTRTSPVDRGKWILENILGTPPPSPPGTVPPLQENANGSGGELSLRQRMQEHRKSPQCAGCHRLMDPIGFSLENFDAVGRWRSTEGNQKIDASGELADGTKVDGPASLRQALLGYSDQFVQTVTEKLLTYAMGRGVQYYDMPTVRGIVREAARNDYRFSSIVRGIVNSTPFQMQTKDRVAE
ncbi:MAG TPA: DUF1592 domain-containing protein [Bryobacteraceae bacterium]